MSEPVHLNNQSDNQQGDRPVDQFDRPELAGLVCHYFAQGKSMSAIAEVLRNDHHISGVNRETPYQLLQYGTQRSWLRYVPPPSRVLGPRLRKRHPFLREVVVPEHGDKGSVITSAADLVVSRIMERAREKTDRTMRDPELRSAAARAADSYPGKEAFEIGIAIGFSAGSTIGNLSKVLGPLLARRVEDMEKELKRTARTAVKELLEGGQVEAGAVPDPKKILIKLKFILMNLVSGFDRDPANLPIGFLTAMVSRSILEEHTEFQCFNAPSFCYITDSDAKLAAFVPQFFEVREYARNNLEIIVTSGGSIDDEHSMFSKYSQPEDASRTTREIFAAHGVTGDLMWLPVKAKTATESGSLFDFKRDLSKEDQRDLQHCSPMTLLDLEDLGNLVAQGKDVVLILGPCDGCAAPKNQVIGAVLDQRTPVVSHLVADRRTVSRFLESSEE